MNYPKLANCSAEFVCGALIKIGGFSLKLKSAKHYKVEHRATKKCWMIVRHSPIKRGAMWDMVRNYLQPLGYTEEKIFKYLWC